ncbi:MAG: S9 family peptidase [bacterium]
MPSPMPPIAIRKPTTTSVHGDARTDDYAWMREKGTEPVTAYLEAENAYANAVLEPLKPLEAVLYGEMLDRIKEDDESFPYELGGWLYYSRTEAGKQYAVHCRKRSDDSPEEILLDLNAMAEGHSYMGLGAYQPSPDGRYLAYSTDTTGFRQYTLVVKDLESGDHLAFEVQQAGTVAWSNDNNTIFYTVDDEAKRPARVFRYQLNATSAQFIYEEPDEMFRVSIHRARSGQYLFLTSASHTSTEVRYLAAGDALSEWQLIAQRVHEHEYYADHHSDWLYFLSNDAGRNFRVVRAPLASPGREHWQEVVAHRDAVMIEDLDLFAGHMVLSTRAGGLQRLEVIRLSDGEEHTVEFPEPVFTVFTGPNRVWDATLLRYNYQSPVTPPQVVDYDMNSRSMVVRKELEVPGYDRFQYETERLWIAAEDGTKVPVSVVSKRGLRRDGSAPMLLQGYGSYGANYPINFNSNRVSLLDRGIVVACAHIRGGGEMGKAWHDDGKMMTKMNTFTDFVDVAEGLVERGFTSADRLIATGRSAGGLLMGAVMNLRPELFKAVVAGVPFVDVVNTMLDSTLPLTVGEWEEWGNPNVPEEYRYMKGYCPYSNVEAKPYPALFVKTALNDSQVMYWEPAKWVAKLRAHKTDANPLVFRTDMGAGHGGASGRYDYLNEVAEEYAFILWQAGKSAL